MASSSYASSSRQHGSNFGALDTDSVSDTAAYDLGEDYLCALLLQMELIADDRKTGQLGKASMDSDAQIAADFALAEAQELEQSLKLAKSLATCGYVPDELVSELTEQDAQVQNDRDLALRMSRGEPSVIRDVEASSSRYVGLIRWFRTVAECCSCSSDDKRTYRAPCGHDYCLDCSRSLYSGALLDRGLIPVRCCHQSFATEVAAVCLTDEGDHTKYETMRREIENPCPPPEELDVAASALITERGWKVCPRCGAVIERKEGCVHMTCICRHEFCYTCMRRWQTCTCELYPTEELNQILNERIGNADAGNDRHRLRNVLRNYYGHEHRWARQAPAGRVCNVCSWNMPLYCLHCNVCRETRCFRCCYNR